MAESKEIAVKEKNITDSVLERVNSFRAEGALSVPKDYSPANALKSAWLMLQDVQDRSKNPVLTSCSKNSIANALLDMVVQGLSPAKKQVYFIAYGNKLTLSRSYFGNIALAKRVAGLKNITSNVILKGDTFKYGIDPDTGIKQVLKHEQKLEDLGGEVIGAYAILTFEDGHKHVEVMNIKQIQSSWNMGQSNGNSPAHKAFQDEMAKKTVINRSLKTFISSSDDSHLMEEEERPEVEDVVKDQIADNANMEELSIESEAEDAEIVDEPEVKEEPKKPKANDGMDNGAPKAGGPGF